MQTVRDKTVISDLCWYACDRYGLLITVGGVSGDFSQTGRLAVPSVPFRPIARLSITVHATRVTMRTSSSK